MVALGLNFVSSAAISFLHIARLCEPSMDSLLSCPENSPLFDLSLSLSLSFPALLSTFHETERERDIEVTLSDWCVKGFSLLTVDLATVNFNKVLI